MIEKIKRISSPLTVIGIFAGIAEIAATVVLLNLDSNMQELFVWFVILFPILLVLLFFLILFINPTVLYGPSDYKDESNFISIMKSSSNNNKSNSEKEKKIIQNEIFINKIIEIDHKSFQSCQFKNCQLLYKAEGAFDIVNCEFSNANWGFQDSAAQTLHFISSLYSEFGEGGKLTVEQTIKNIKEGKYR